MPPGSASAAPPTDRPAARRCSACRMCRQSGCACSLPPRGAARAALARRPARREHGPRADDVSEEHQRLLAHCGTWRRALAATVLPARRARRRWRADVPRVDQRLWMVARAWRAVGRAQLRDFFADHLRRHNVGGRRSSAARWARAPSRRPRAARKASSERNRRRHAPAATFASVATSGMRQQLRTDAARALRVTVMARVERGVRRARVTRPGAAASTTASQASATTPNNVPYCARRV